MKKFIAILHLLLCKNYVLLIKDSPYEFADLSDMETLDKLDCVMIVAEDIKDEMWQPIQEELNLIEVNKILYN